MQKVEHYYDILKARVDMEKLYLSLELNKNDMSIETLVVPVKSKSYE